jgi:hypothetical protein
VAKRQTSYEAWLQLENIPIHYGYGIEDISILPRGPWQRTGGNGAYVELKGMEGFTGMYVGEIPAGGALNPENHLYEKLVYVLRGVGATEIWPVTDEKRKMHFEWQQGSLFAIPGGHERAADDRLIAQHAFRARMRLQISRSFRRPAGLFRAQD